MPSQVEKSLQICLAPTSVNQPRLTASRTSNVAKANVRKSPDIGDYFKVDPESRVEEAHVNFGPVQDEPITPFRRLPKLEVDNDTVIGQIFCPYQPVQDPHEEVRIKVLVAEITT